MNRLLAGVMATLFVALVAANGARGQSDAALDTGETSPETDGDGGSAPISPESLMLKAEVLAEVRLADGTPVEGAVVLTSAGGQGVTDANGVALFEIRVSPEAERVVVTAAASSAIDGLNYKGRVEAPLVHAETQSADGDTASLSCLCDAGVIVVEAGGACEPEWVPTFGGQPGVDGSVNALVVFDDGPGPALFVGGTFDSAGGITANRVAKWDGVEWTALGSGVTGGGSSVSALEVFDDGRGPALFAGGFIIRAGGVLAANIARWDGVEWSPLGSGVGGPVGDIAVFDDGTGPALYVAGEFSRAGDHPANRLAKWDGATWSPVVLNVDHRISTLAVFNDGAGSALFAGGSFVTIGGVDANRVARWDGANWSPLGDGLGGVYSSTRAHTLAVVNDGTGPSLFAGGWFSSAGGVSAKNLAKWSGKEWSALDEGLIDASGITSVNGLVEFDDGSGSALYAGGRFTSAGGSTANRIAKWNGVQWSPLGSGFDDVVNTLVVFDDGAGAALYAGGRFDFAGTVPAIGIARWDGTTWSAIGSGFNNTVDALAVADDGTAQSLFAGGRFTAVDGERLGLVGQWNGDTWSSLDEGLDFGSVGDLIVFDDGTGSALYVGSGFFSIGGMLMRGVAKWDGATWSSLDDGLDGFVAALEVFDDGAGEALFAAGGFTTTGTLEVNRIAKWDGDSWTALNGGLDDRAFCLAVFDDGTGPSLYVGGNSWKLGASEPTTLLGGMGATGFLLAVGCPSLVFSLSQYSMMAWERRSMSEGDSIQPVVLRLTISPDGMVILGRRSEAASTTAYAPSFSLIRRCTPVECLALLEGFRRTTSPSGMEPRGRPLGSGPTEWLRPSPYTMTAPAQTSM